LLLLVWLLHNKDKRRVRYSSGSCMAPALGLN
jgi:hypothetical protein